MKIIILKLQQKELDLKINTLEIIKNRDLTYQKQVVNTMYNRAKYHPNQTNNMKEAMKIFNIWLKKINKLGILLHIIILYNLFIGFVKQVFFENFLFSISNSF